MPPGGRNRTRHATARITAVLTVVLASTLGACGALQQDQENGGQPGAASADPAMTHACDRAINVASFMPNFVAPEHARSDARAKLAEIDRLIHHAGDQELREDLGEVRSSVHQVATGEISLENSETWADKQSKHYEQVSTTCSSN